MTSFARRAALALAALSLMAGGLNALPASAAESGTATINQQINCTGGNRAISVGSVTNPSAVNFGDGVQITNASFSLQAGVTGCSMAGWKVNLQATGSGAIAASNVATVSVPNPTRVSGQPALPTTDSNANGPLDSARTVMTAAPNTGNGTYAQTIPLNLTIPAYTLPGTYTVTVTASIVVGPQ